MGYRVVICVALAVLAPPLPPAFAEGDVQRGARLFQACAVCHSTKPGEHLTGPSLASVWESKAGTTNGFQRYSEAIKRSGVVWISSTLEKWLTDPAAFLPGTSMMFPGIPNARDRRDVIACLRAVSAGKAPDTSDNAGGMAGGMGGMMHGSGGRTDLRKAPPEGRVTSLTHCGDTYEVTTADDKVEKVWEFNLRLKTDSSKQGPQEGQPVIVGSGMRGDRASVVLSKPGEISAFIRSECSSDLKK